MTQHLQLLILASCLARFIHGFILDSSLLLPSPRHLSFKSNRRLSPLHDTESSSNDSYLAGFESTTESFVVVSEVFVAHVESLRERFDSFENDDDDTDGNNNIKFHNRRQRRRRLNSNGDGNAFMEEDCDIEDDYCNLDSHVANLRYTEFVANDEVVLADAVRKPGMKSVSRAFLRAGPRQSLHFDPSKVNAAIVTAGGLCPGLNNVIRELVHSLHYLYGANHIYGVTGGFHGFHNPDYPPISLTPNLVENIHHDGGTILRTSRGGFEIDKILEFLTMHEINQLYIIGGDGTHRGAYAIHQACMEKNLNIAVAGIPKTIDNDVDLIDRSFGFQSAVEAAQLAIHSAKTEAFCNVPNGIGICKLMGRSAGFLAAFAALGSQDVDLCLVPEVPIELDRILPFLRKRIQEQKYAVVVVAEGAGEELLGVSGERDAGGNRALPEIGPYLQKEIKEYFQKLDEKCTIKYIDPSYTVRTVPANGADSLYCQLLAMDAVHGCMNGYTGFSVGLINRQNVLIPIPVLVASSPRNLNPHGTTWARVLAMTGQPDTMPEEQQDNIVELETVFPSDSAAPDAATEGETIVMESGLCEPSPH